MSGPEGSSIKWDSHVPQECLGRANCLSNAYGTQSTEGARQLNLPINETHLSYGWVFYFIEKEIAEQGASAFLIKYIKFYLRFWNKGIIYDIILKMIGGRGRKVELSSIISCVASAEFS